jgi:hypothetical protein
MRLAKGGNGEDGESGGIGYSEICIGGVVKFAWGCNVNIIGVQS